MVGHRHCEKSARDERTPIRDVLIEKNWKENMINSMKRLYQLWKMIDLKINHRKELDKLWEL